MVVISRRPDTFTHAQFYAEDGRCSFADAYTLGPWQALFLPDQGHILMQPRLIALIAFPFGVASAPLIYNIFGLLFQVAPVAFFLSDRFRPVLRSIWWRAALCVVYLLIPSAELQVTAGNSQWHLAVLASLVLIAPTPEAPGLARLRYRHASAVCPHGRFRLRPAPRCADLVVGSAPALDGH